MYAVFTKESAFGQSVITEDNELYFQIEEYNDDSIQEAKENGMKFAHLFEEKIDDYDQTYYTFITSEIIWFFDSRELKCYNITIYLNEVGYLK